MDPVIDNDWLGCKNDSIDDVVNIGNVARSWLFREHGINAPHSPANKTVLENNAEDILVGKQLKIRCCDLPGYPRSTFLMVFSPDGTKVASTHGNHNVYVSELSSGKHVRILKGHPRTPWCIAFHPSHPQLIGSGCLGGQVRVWDISSGGSEVWNVRNETVIASIAFHPREQLLVIATFNELYFWDWSQPAPFTKVSTNNVNEKVRYVAFDALGYKLVTGISLWSSPSGGPPTVLQPNGTWGPPNNPNNNRRDDRAASPGGNGPQDNNSGSAAQDMIVNSYQNLVQRYDSLVRNYQRLFMVRHRLISNPPPPNMIDRGTDPMETDVSPISSGVTRTPRQSTSAASNDTENPIPGPSHRQDGADIADVESNSSRLLNLDVLSFDSNPSRNEDSPSQEHSIFGSRPSAFQPLNESGRSFRTVDQNERSSRILPNPFSSSNSSTLTSMRSSFSESFRSAQRNIGGNNTSRTSIFTSSRPEPLDFSRRRRNSSPSHHNIMSSPNRNSSSNLNSSPSTSTARPLTILSSSILESMPSTSRATRPTMTNSSTQMSPVNAPVDQTINESLNLIRDILRDSGTRLLNLITNMSYSTLANVERNMPRRGAGSRAHSDDGHGSHRPRGGMRPRVRLFSSSLRREFISSSSDSDSDQSLEVNIFRTRNSTFREDEPGEQTSTQTSTDAAGTATTDTARKTPNNATPCNAGSCIANDSSRDGASCSGGNVSSTSLSHTENEASNVTSEGSSNIVIDAANNSSNKAASNATSTAASNFEKAAPSNSIGAAANSTASAAASSTVNVALCSTASAAASSTANAASCSTASAATSSTANAASCSTTNTAESSSADAAAHNTSRTSKASNNANGAEAAADDTPGTSSQYPYPFVPPDSFDYELSDDVRNENLIPEEPRYIGRFRVRTMPPVSYFDPLPLIRARRQSPDGDRLESRRNPASETEPRPSTSRDNFWTRGCAVPPDEAYRKVKSGVAALHKHTLTLTNMWLRGSRVTMRELRAMWEILRRRILVLHRETGRQDLPSYYTRSLLERCMMLTDMTDNVTRANRARNNQRHEESGRQGNDNAEASTSTANTNDSNATGDTNRSTENTEARPHRGRSPHTRPANLRSSPLRRRLRLSHRWRPEDEIRRRTRNPVTNRLAPRLSEISATRHEIRMRAMQVLSVMFNMMMMCLEERGLSHVIINMLRTLKKALAITCLMLMTNRFPPNQTNRAAANQQVESLNVVRIENVEHPGPVNVDGPDDPSSPRVSNEPEEARGQKIKREKRQIEKESTNQTPNSNSAMECEPGPSTQVIPNSQSQRWSNRLAVQIAAANRNTSNTARTRHDLYMESRRQKALHRTNPTAHPLIRKRALPPVTTYRIPALRSWASKPKPLKSRTEPRPIEPVAGPSSAPDNVAPNGDNESQSQRTEVLNEFEQRVNLIRIAHMQAVRLRNAARNRFRRLQTIRLYTPSSVREMFALQTNNTDNPPPGSRSPIHSSPNGPETPLGNRRPLTYRPHILTPRSDAANRSPDEPGQFHTVLNNVAMPLMHVNDLPLHPEIPGNPQHRLPRIQEYLQPIILAQNAMLVDDENGAGDGGGDVSGSGGGGGGSGGAGGPRGPSVGGPARRVSAMAGLLDAGIISEALPAPSHRVQAWDFTTGNTPDIADSTKNVVVQKCRIHNDASIDISKDGRLLVALLPVPRLRNTNHWLGVYSLEWSRLGQCLYTAVLEQSAVSVALSPTARHLAVGLGSRRFTSTPHARSNVFALLYRLDPLESSSRTGLTPIQELEQHWEHGFTSLNCLRWAPQPGQGLVYANNTGQLIIMS